MICGSLRMCVCVCVVWWCVCLRGVLCRIHPFVLGTLGRTPCQRVGSRRGPSGNLVENRCSVGLDMVVPYTGAARTRPRRAEILQQQKKGHGLSWAGYATKIGGERVRERRRAKVPCVHLPVHHSSTTIILRSIVLCSYAAYATRQANTDDLESESHCGQGAEEKRRGVGVPCKGYFWCHVILYGPAGHLWRVTHPTNRVARGGASKL